MKTSKKAILASAAFAAGAVLSGQSFGQTILYNPVVTQVGDGSVTAAGTGYTTTIQVYQNTVASQAAPVAQAAYGGSALLTNTNSSAEAELSNNPGVMDAAALGNPYSGTAYVFSGGYATADATAAVTSTSTVNRNVGYMTVTSNSVSGKTIGATATEATAYTGNSIRGTTGTDNVSSFWSAGTGSTNPGLRYMNTNTQLATTPTNTRVTQIRGGQLYEGSDTVVSSVQYVGISVVGSGLPTASGTTVTPLFSTGSSSTQSPYQFLLLNDPNNPDPPALTVGTSSVSIPYNVAYLADAGNASAAAGGIEKWTYTGASGNNGWSLDYTFLDSNAYDGITVGNTGNFGLAGQLLVDPDDSTQDNVVLYSTNNDGTALEQWTDPLEARDNTTATEIILATAPTNDLFRGVALAPIVVPEPTTLGLLSIGALSLLGRRRRTSR